MTRKCAVVVTAFDDADLQRAHTLAESLDVSFVADDWTRIARFALTYDSDNRLALLDAREPEVTGIVVRFDTLPIRRGRVQVSRREPLGRAIGPHVETVVDATAGLGQDAFLLACMGFRVTAIERSPIVAALLEDGLRRIREVGRYREGIGDRLRVVVGDARTYLAEPPPPDAPPEAVYLDPMFPPKRKKSALTKKPLRLLRELVGDDSDTLELFDIAIKSARQRVIIKRPDHAPPLAPRPAASITGKLVRYDIYSPAASLGSSLRIQQ